MKWMGIYLFVNGELEEITTSKYYASGYNAWMRALDGKTYHDGRVWVVVELEVEE